MMGDDNAMSVYKDDMFTKTATGYAYDYESRDESDYGSDTVSAHADLIMKCDKLSRIKGMSWRAIATHRWCRSKLYGISTTPQPAQA
jgi:hypothetical protein